MTRILLTLSLVLSLAACDGDQTAEAPAETAPTAEAPEAHGSDVGDAVAGQAKAGKTKSGGGTVWCSQVTDEQCKKYPEECTKKRSCKATGGGEGSYQYCDDACEAAMDKGDGSGPTETQPSTGGSTGR